MNLNIDNWCKYGIDCTQDFERAIADLIGSRPNGISRCDVEQFAADYLVSLLSQWQIEGLIRVWSFSGGAQSISGFGAAYKEHCDTQEQKTEVTRCTCTGRRE